MIKIVVLFGLISALWSWHRVHGEIFSSMDEMVKLPGLLDQVSQDLDHFIGNYEKILDLLKKSRDNIAKISEKANSNAKKFMSNPINSFLMIKLFAKDLDFLFELIDSSLNATEKLQELRDDFVFPDETDYNGAVLALLRLEDTYNLSPVEMRNGTFGNSRAFRPLNGLLEEGYLKQRAFECFEFGRIAQETNDHFHAIRWLNEALSLIKTNKSESSLKEETVLEYLAFSHYNRGNYLEAYELNKKLLEADPSNYKFYHNLHTYQDAISDEVFKKIQAKKGQETITIKELFEFETKNDRPLDELGYREAKEFLCREEILQTKKLPNLHCRYVHYHPLLLIAPIKQEQVFDDPPIWVFYDVITEAQTETLIESVRPKLQRAQVFSEKTVEADGKVVSYRISKNGWLNDQEADFLPGLKNLVGALTGLNMESAEHWQMNNYGLGGVYEPHFDFSRPFELDSLDETFGMRIATWMFYLEAPEMGGGTAFPEIGAVVKAVNRSAVFWFNMLSNGEPDYRTRHGGCPVLVGSKWVSNKWIRSKGQEFYRPCGLQQYY